MIRTTLLLFYILILSAYAWKDWYVSLCGLILLMVVIEHPDMPKSIMGIQGINPWNLLFFVVLMAWMFHRRREGLVFDMPFYVKAFLFAYLGVILVGFARLYLFPGEISVATPEGEVLIYSKSELVSEYLINSIKWVIPGILLFDGCRSRKRFDLALFTILAIYLLLALQIVKWMPLGDVMRGDELAARSLKILRKEVGYHRVNLAMMMAGGAWAILAVIPIARTRIKKSLVLLAGMITAFATALTAGRSGYLTWVVVGIILCLLKWRKFLFAIPFVALSIVLAVPGTMERITQGFSPETRDYNALVGAVPTHDDRPDAYTITAGRNIAWKYVLEKIQQSPIVGYGRQAMITTGLADFMWVKFRENFPHPHNAYLEMLLDSGILGFLIVVPFYLILVKHSISLFRDRRSPVFAAAGGTSCALIAALLVAAFGSQTFYPREGSVGMWCSIGLLLRVYLERKKCDETGPVGGNDAAWVYSK